jgi:hypothetical protein
MLIECLVTGDYALISLSGRLGGGALTCPCCGVRTTMTRDRKDSRYQWKSSFHPRHRLPLSIEGRCRQSAKMLRSQMVEHVEAPMRGAPPKSKGEE